MPPWSPASTPSSGARLMDASSPTSAPPLLAAALAEERMIRGEPRRRESGGAPAGALATGSALAARHFRALHGAASAINAEHRVAAAAGQLRPGGAAATAGWRGPYPRADTSGLSERGVPGLCLAAAVSPAPLPQMSFSRRGLVLPHTECLARAWRPERPSRPVGNLETRRREVQMVTAPGSVEWEQRRGAREGQLQSRKVAPRVSPWQTLGQRYRRKRMTRWCMTMVRMSKPTMTLVQCQPPPVAGDEGAPRAEGTQAHADDDDGADEDGDGAEVDAQCLRQRWQELSRAHRRMERDSDMPPSIVAEAKRLRDDAEQKWRAAKVPHPLSKRMRWAEADLRAAEQKEEAHRAELEQHLEATARRTRELEDRIKVDVERTARKRAILQELLAEGVPAHVLAADRIPAARAAAAVTGISEDIAPQLAAAIERLGSPMENDTAEGVRQDLQLVAVSINNLEDLLRGTLVPTVPPGSALHQQQQASHYHIGSDGGGGGDSTGAEDDDARGGKRRAVSTGGGTTTVARWTKSAVGDAWTKCNSSAAAKEEAMRVLGARGGGAGGAAAGRRGDGVGNCPSHQPATATHAASASTQPAGAAETNDLAEAERRARQAAQHQFQEAQQQQHQRVDARVQQQEELDKQQRRRRQEEELLAHQQAAQRAAEERAADEARQREELLARMSPQDLAAAAELHAQHMAIGAQAFGTQAASDMAGLVHQQHAHHVARTSAAGGMQADADQLIAMSPEELAQWDREQQATAGEVPW